MLSLSEVRGKCLAKEKEKAKIRVPAAWHSLVEQCREGSRTMPESHRQT